MNSNAISTKPIENKEQESDIFLSRLKSAYERDPNSPDFSKAEMNRQACQLIYLINTLEKIEEDNVLISIGSPLENQSSNYQPIYKKFQNMKVCVSS